MPTSVSGAFCTRAGCKRGSRKVTKVVVGKVAAKPIADIAGTAAEGIAAVVYDVTGAIWGAGKDGVFWLLRYKPGKTAKRRNSPNSPPRIAAGQGATRRRGSPTTAADRRRNEQARSAARSAMNAEHEAAQERYRAEAAAARAQAERERQRQAEEAEAEAQRRAAQAEAQRRAAEAEAQRRAAEAQKAEERARQAEAQRRTAAENARRRAEQARSAFPGSARPGAFPGSGFPGSARSGAFPGSGFPGSARPGAFPGSAPRPGPSAQSPPRSARPPPPPPNNDNEAKLNKAFTFLKINRADFEKLSKDAKEKTLKVTYRKLSLEHHPNKGGNEETFKKVGHANELIRAKYDMSK